MKKDDKHSSLDVLLGARVRAVSRSRRSDGRGETVAIDVYQDNDVLRVSIQSKSDLVFEDHSVLDPAYYERSEFKEERSESYHEYVRGDIDEEIHQQFIRLWDRAVASPEYDKKDWQHFRGLFSKLGWEF